MRRRTAWPFSTMERRLSKRQFLPLFVFFGLAAGQKFWEDSSTDKITFPVCSHNGACPVYYDGDTLLVSYTLGHSKRVERLVMLLVCMAMEDDNPPARFLVLSDEALTVSSIKDDLPSSAGTVPFTLPAVPQLHNVSWESGTSAAFACATILKGERVRDCAPVDLQSEPFQLRAASGYGYTASRKTYGFEGEMMPWNKVHPTMTGGGTYGHRPTFSFTRPSFTISTFVSTATFHADPTTLVLPLATSGTDKRAPEGFSKVVVGIGVGAAVGVLFVGLTLFFPLRRRFRRWRWRRMDAQSHELRPAWIIQYPAGATQPGGNEPEMAEIHGNPMNTVSEVHSAGRPTPELGSGVPLERVQLRRDDRHERNETTTERNEERLGRNEERTEEGTAERAAERHQERVEEVAEERSNRRVEERIEDCTEERSAERAEEGAEEGGGEGIEDRKGNEMEEQDEERNKERIEEPFELP